MFATTDAFSGFAVDDLDAAQGFYRQTPGLVVSEQHGLLGLYLAGGVDVLVYPEPDHIPASFTVPHFVVDNFDGAVDALTARGVTFAHYDTIAQDDKGIARPPRGAGPSIASFTDPAGNVVSGLQAQ